MCARRLVRESLSQAAGQEAYERLKRISEVTYDDVLTRVAYGTPEAVVERIRWYQEELGITGVSPDMNPGGQLPRHQVVYSIKLLAGKPTNAACIRCRSRYLESESSKVLGGSNPFGSPSVLIDTEANSSTSNP